MITNEQLKELRALGVKCASFHGGEMITVEFFPAALPVATDPLANWTADRDTEAPPADGDQKPRETAFDRLMKGGDYS